MNKYAATLYRLAPVWGQNLMLTGFSTLLDRERYGGRFAEFQALLARSERWSRGEMEAYQDERLRAVVQHAYEHVPFYRKRFDERKLTPVDIRGRRDLHKLPLLTRDDIRRNFDDLRSRTIAARALKTGHTSGTTGTPLTVGYDHDTIWMTYAVFDRHYQWAGCRLASDGGDRIAVARGNVIVPLDQQQPPYWRINRRHHQLLLSSFHLSVDAVSAGEVSEGPRSAVSRPRRGHVVRDAVRLAACGHRRELRVPRIRLLRAGRARRLLG
jgi:phenylacetate-CoA ligase